MRVYIRAFLYQYENISMNIYLLNILMTESNFVRN